MTAVYKLIVSPKAPTLRVNEPFAKAFLQITGQEDLIGLSPGSSFTGTLTQLGSWRQFYSVCPGAIAISETAWEHCMDMYYEITENDIALLSVATPDANMRIIVPREVNPPAKDSSQPCDLHYANTLFRIADRDLTELYCQQPFVGCYGQFGFEGLEFVLEWTPNEK